MQSHNTIRLTALSIALALSLPSLAHAQVSGQATGKPTDFDNVLVTATRTAITANNP